MPGKIPSLDCKGWPGLFQSNRPGQPPEINRGHRVLFFERTAGGFGPMVADGQFKFDSMGDAKAG